MHDVILTGGSVLTSDGIQMTDVAIADGVIVALGDDLGNGRDTIHCDGAWVGPGLVDIHTHLREPGQEWREDVATGSVAAAAGGFTAIVAMPNTEPAIDTGHVARFVIEQGQRAGLVEVASAGCLTIGRAGEKMAHIDELWDAGVRIFTDDGDSVGNASVLRSAMEYVAQLGGVVSQHAVDSALSSVGYMHEGSVSSRLGIYGIPREADDITIARDIALAKLTGVRYHVQHLSTAGGVELVAAAKADGLPVTAEVTPHHLMYTHEDVATADSRYKMMPPLREPSDREALIDALRTGIIDIVATDHAPHAATEKDVPFEQAANGVTGLEWSAAVTNQVVGLDQETFFRRMSIAPSAIAGFIDQGNPLEVGCVANVVVFDPDATWLPKTSLSKSRNAPYFGTELQGVVTATVFSGRITHAG
jgi:dihydroorotase